MNPAPHPHPGAPAMHRVVLLGPQRDRPTLRDALSDLIRGGAAPRIAVVTAGWEEREAELLPFRRHVDMPVIDLGVFARVESIYQQDPQLRTLVHARHDQVRVLQKLYRERLAHVLQAAREAHGAAAVAGAAPDVAGLLAEERDHATRAVRQLDALHVRRLRQLDARSRPLAAIHERPAVHAHRRQLTEQLAECDILCIAGGHVGILLSRMHLLGVTTLHRGLPGPRPIVAWSAGAMALTDHVVLFHDSPPQGRGDPEIHGPGLGLARDLVALPHASRRLQLDDRARVALFADRFAPRGCAVLDPGARFERGPTDSAWMAAPGSRWLHTDGLVTEGRR